MLRPTPARSLLSRRGIAVAGGALVLLAASLATAGAGPTVPLVLVLALVAVCVTLGSPWHGLLLALVATSMLPVPFSMKVGPVTASVGRVLLWSLAVGWLAARSREDRPVRWRRTPFDIPLLVLLAVLLASTVANSVDLPAGDVLAALRRTGVFAVDYALLFWIAVSTLHVEGRVPRLLRVVAGISVAGAALGLVERWTGTNVFELAGPVLPAGVAELVDEVARTSADTLVRGRISRVRSTFEGPLPFGIVLLLGLPLATAFALQARTPLRRLGWAVGTGLIGSAILLTAARSVYVLTAVSVVTLVALLPDRRSRLAVMGAAAGVSVLFLAQPDVRDTMFVFFRPDRGVVLEGSVQARVNDYAPVLRLVDDRPFLGYGPRSFNAEALSRTQRLDDPGNVVLDNAYLEILAETGFLGLLALLALLLTAYGAAWRLVRATTDHDDRLLAIALLVVVQSWLLMGFAADVYAFNAPPRLFFALLAALAVMRVRVGWPDDLPAARAPVPPPATATAPAPAG